jgi:hypothetical protein
MLALMEVAKAACDVMSAISDGMKTVPAFAEVFGGGTGPSNALNRPHLPELFRERGDRAVLSVPVIKATYSDHPIQLPKTLVLSQYH